MLVAEALKLNPPIQYNPVWLFIGTMLVLFIALWYWFAFWLTRRKPLKSLENLRPLAPADLNSLKMKYLQLIEEAYQRYSRKEIKLRELHLTLSMLVRQFVQEASHFPAPFLTLSDLMLAPYPVLTQLIAAYYPEEFAAVTNGDARTSTDAAKGVVTQWYV